MPPIDLDALIAELQQEVDARRRSGDYPEGLERQLAQGFAAMVDALSRQELNTAQLGNDVRYVGDAVRRVTADFGRTSRIPGGASAHAAAGRVVQRHTGPLAESIRDLGHAVERSLREVLRLLEAQRSADERQIHDVFASVLDRLAVLDHVVEVLHDIEERVRRLEAETNPVP